MQSGSLPQSEREGEKEMNIIETYFAYRFIADIFFAALGCSILLVAFIYQAYAKRKGKWK